MTRWVEWASWWNRHLACDNFPAGCPKDYEAENQGEPVVRYGAGYPNTGARAENQGKPAPNAPYATFKVRCTL
ncbi:MAG: hypothetical protein F6K56_11745 [Moorea sp. SIO3G5]|nr:hypothetical protein [Moorena sp. SIO3G5]